MGYDHGLLQQEWYPEDFNQVAESSNNVWSYDDFVETFDPEQHNQLTVLCYIIFDIILMHKLEYVAQTETAALICGRLYYFSKLSRERPFEFPYNTSIRR